MTATVIIPAHNEAAVIVESLRSLGLLMSKASESSIATSEPTLQTPALRVLVVCNGCSDDTAARAREVPGVEVIESPIPSKVKAINLGLDAAQPGPVIVMDADIRLKGGGLGSLFDALARPGVLAAAPRAEMEYAPGTAWMVRAYYRLWFSMSYVSEGMVGCGVYALNQAGRERIGQLPDIIADDGYVRASFAPSERVRVDDVAALVRAPRTLRDLVKIKSRSRLGYFQLRHRCGGSLPGQNERPQHAGAWTSLLAKPSLWPCIPPYLYVNLIARRRARRQLESLASYVWERDESARHGAVRA